MSATKIARMSRAGHALAQLSTWPSVQACRADCGHGVGIGTHAGQILHFHDEDHADLRLTQPVINRLRVVLAQSGVDVIPDDDWIGIRLETPSDTTLLVTLVSVAIKANSAEPRVACQRTPSCGSGGVRGGLRRRSRS